MPLFMDFHIVSDITIEEVKEAHIADKSVQDKYGVKYHQFWINKEAGTIFCLIEAPDIESCERVHQEAHGNIACKIVEVEGGFYKLFMGDSHQLDHGIVLAENGDLDNAFRFILVIDIWGKTKATDTRDLPLFIFPDKPNKLIRRIIPSYNGRELKNHNFNEFLAVFDKAHDAVNCALEIQSQFLEHIENSPEDSWNITFKMGVGGGQPLTRESDFFEQTIQLSRRLSLAAEESEIMVSNLVRKMSGFTGHQNQYTQLKSIYAGEEDFLEKLFDITEQNLSDHSFNVESLCQNIGMSRTQLYRKVTSLTGTSPVTFIRDLRLKKALSLINDDRYNLSEVALEIGFTNPSYFSKCFRKKYGVNASNIVF